MPFTTAQIAVIVADIAANADMNTATRDNPGCQVICDLYNAPSTTDVWATSASVNAITDAIDFSKYTPADSIPVIDAVTGNGAILQMNTRALVIQTKQMNLQLMLQGRTTIDASKANIRAGLRDAVISLPAGTAGALVSAGGANAVTVLSAMTRKANRLEKLLSTAGVQTGGVTANVLTYEGGVTNDQMQAIRGI